MISRAPALREQVYANIRDRIVSGDLEPGRVMVEVELAEELHVSRTPVSNALIMLRERGLLEEEGGRLRVPILTLPDVIQLYWCRLAHDGLASRLAAQRITASETQKLESYLRAWESPVQENDYSALWVSDLNFHQLIYQLAGNKHLLRFSETTMELGAAYQRNTFRRMTDPNSGTQRSRNDVRAEHEAIFVAIAAHRPDEAEQAARQHVQMVLSHLEQADVLL